MKQGYCYIFGAAEIDNKLKMTPVPGKDFIIAADAGYRHLDKFGLKPDMVVGDFDSLCMIPDGVEVLRFPVMKDDTDLMLAIRHGFACGYRQFIIYGAMGGRLDFTLANFQILSNIVNLGGSVNIFGCGSVTTAVKDGRLEFDEHFTGRISVFCSGEAVYDVTLRGLEYPLTKAILTYDEPLGVSNHFTGTRGYIEAGQGILTVIYDDVNEMMKIVKNNENRH